jgi:hypothetical protein
MNTKKQELQNIKKIWDKIEYKINNHGWNKYATEYLRLNREESRQHIQGRPDGVKHHLTITEESKFFAVQTIAKYLYIHNEKNSLSVKDYLSIRRSHFMACALCLNFTDELKSVMSPEEGTHLISLDYCEFAQKEDF